jgi:putative cardiolipin synthase
MGEPVSELNLVSPYFVPTADGVEALVELARSKVKVKVLTNSLEATDVAAVHSGYARWRKPMLDAGVQLYELKRTWPRDDAPKKGGPGGSSGSSLHAKTFAVDRQRMYVGSFNFDYRSADLNTEMGFVIDSPALAERMSTVLGTQVPDLAYEVKLGPDGKLYWLEQGPAGPVRHDVEPGTGLLQRLSVDFMSLLPIDWLL